MSDIKKDGQVFTPVEIVNLILDEVGYKDENILTKKIMEPSFGQGVFIIEIIKRILQTTDITKASAIIKSNVFGIEKDPALYKETIKNIYKFLKLNNIQNIDLSKNFICGDTIDIYKKFKNQFDFVIGNPPYVRIHNIDTKDKLSNFSFNQGNTDLYVLFYEMGLKMLNNTGKLGFITPNSFLKNSSQKFFRNYIAKNNLIQKIFDFKNSKIFDGFDVYAAIMILDKNKENTLVLYREYNMFKKIFEEYFDVKNLLQGLWIFSSKENTAFLEEINQRKHAISDEAIIQNGIATNKDSVYIGKAFIDKENTIPYVKKANDTNKIVYFNGHKIESDILRRCVKESKFNGIIDNTYIIYPYVYKNNSVNIIDEKIFELKYPLTYKYLLNNKSVLNKRDMEKNLPWYAFARSQGLLNMNKPKMIFKHIIEQTSEMRFYLLDKDVVIYSGFFTTSESKKVLRELIKTINKDDFKKYCLLVGKNMAGGYVAISSKNFKDYKKR